MSRPRNRLRRWLLALTLAISVGASLWVREQEAMENSIATVAPREVVASVAPQNQFESLALGRLNRRQPTGTDIDPFRTKSWYVPPPAPPPAPPPVPTAPALPFLLVGKSEDADGGNVLVYLTRGNESFAVQVGEKFDGNYQFEGIEKGYLVITFLPLSVKQRLPVGSSE